MAANDSVTNDVWVDLLDALAQAGVPLLPTTYSVFPSDPTTEGGTLSYTLGRMGGNLPAETVAYTVGGTATSGTDYTAPSGSVAFAPGQTSAVISVVTKTNSTSEPEETVTIGLHGAAASGTITDVVPVTPTTYDVSPAATVAEGGTLSYVVTRTGNNLLAETVAYMVGGTATSGTDYTAPSGSVAFAPGQSSAVIKVVAKIDAISEPEETVTISLHGDTASGTITDVLPLPTSSIDENWNTLKVGAGGWLTGMDIASDGTMVARTDTFGAYVWRADLDQWQQLVTVDSMPTDLRAGGVYEIRIAPSESSIMYMQYGGNLYKSVDTGETWQQTAFQTVWQDANDSTRMYGQKMAVDPVNPNIVYAGTQRDGLFVTKDGGATWSLVASVPETVATADGSTPGFTGIVFDPTFGTSGGMTNAIYAASHGNGVYRSTDAGATWSLLPGSPPKVSFATVDSEGNYYAATGGSTLVKYTDGTWTTVLEAGDVHTVMVDPFDVSHVLVSAGGGTLQESHDGGVTWGDGWNWGTRLESSNDISWLENSGPYMSIGGMVFDPLVPDKLWASAGVGVWTTTLPVEDFVFHTPIIWNSQSRGIEQLVTNDIVVPPGGDPILASWDRSFFTSTNLDAYPTRYDDGSGGLGFAMGWSVDYASSDPSFIVGVSDYWGVEKSGFSTDYGQTWQAFPTLPSFASATIGGSIAASTPDNFIWAPANRGTPAYTLDGGQTWASVDLPGTDNWDSFHWAYYLNKTTVTADRVLDNTFYLYDAGSGVHRSTDGGAHWTTTHVGEVAPFSGFNSKIEAVPGSAGELFFTGGPQGDPFTEDAWTSFMHSEDGGFTWAAVPNVTEVHTFGYGAPDDPSGPATIYIVGYVNHDYGIWESDDNAETWTKIGENPMGSLDFIKTISGDPDNGNVYIGFAGSGYAYLPAHDGLVV